MAQDITSPRHAVTRMTANQNNWVGQPTWKPCCGQATAGRAVGQGPTHSKRKPSKRMYGARAPRCPRSCALHQAVWVDGQARLTRARPRRTSNARRNAWPTCTTLATARCRAVGQGPTHSRRRPSKRLYDGRTPRCPRPCALHQAAEFDGPGSLARARLAALHPKASARLCAIRSAKSASAFTTCARKASTLVQMLANMSSTTAHMGGAPSGATGPCPDQCSPIGELCLPQDRAS